ncbi:MAG: DUF72 domain-containing protein, partial [Candidatus Lokiarchaeota archaeon]|nr:DUF72 domain-containing protein [Candidatus Lokiarchaeota archaeon]
MAKVSLGCAGWDYKDWLGTFYPKPLERHNHLEFYSKFFDIVEINSTFYNIPNKAAVITWYNQVPANFKFVVKVWQKITHNLNDSDLDYLISQFFSQLSPLQEKVAAYLLQFPPWFKFTEKHYSQLKILSNELPQEFKYVIELRDNSWFKEEIVFGIIDGTNFILGTTYMPGIDAHYLQNQNFYYVRLIGDRELSVFNRIQRNQEESINDLVRNLQMLEKMPNVYEIFIIVNNHFQGNGPASAQLLKKRLNIPLKEFNQQ